jgi:hypothetical protein
MAGGFRLLCRGKWELVEKCGCSLSKSPTKARKRRPEYTKISKNIRRIP